MRAGRSSFGSDGGRNGRGRSLGIAWNRRRSRRRCHVALTWSRLRTQVERKEDVGAFATDASGGEELEAQATTGIAVARGGGDRDELGGDEVGVGADAGAERGK